MTGEKEKVKFKKMIIIGSVLFFLTIFLSLFIGTGLRRDDTFSLILFQVRLPRTISAIMCGAAFSASGMLLQSALDNPLCSPGIMGINSGAGFFVLISGMIFPFSAPIRQLFGFAGAITATVLIYVVCRFAGFSKATLILTGVAVSGLFTAASNAIILAAVPWICIGLAVVFLKADHMSLLVLGDESAAGLGVRPDDMRKLSLFISAVLAGSAVSICGMLGFVGLIIPNLIKRAGYFDLRKSLVLCCLYAASFLLICDIISRYLFFPYELPVGLILSFLGSPFFIYVLVKRKRNVLL